MANTLEADVCARRREAGDFLRSRRERLTPAEVGLADGVRRRTPGLRREQVAMLAGDVATSVQIARPWAIVVLRLKKEYGIATASPRQPTIVSVLQSDDIRSADQAGVSRMAETTRSSGSGS